MFLRKYGVQAIIDGIPLITRGAVDYKANPTLAAGDVKISKDGGVFANIEGAGVFADFVAVAPAAGTSVQVKPDAPALECMRLVILFIDQTSPKEWEDQEVIIETFGHASAQYTGDFNSLDAAITSRSTLAAIEGSAVLALEATAQSILTKVNTGAAVGIIVGLADMGVTIATVFRPITMEKGEKKIISYQVVGASGAAIDCTGYTAKLAVKEKISDAVYKIGPIDGVLSADADGVNSIWTWTIGVTATKDLTPFSGKWTAVLYDGSGDGAVMNPGGTEFRLLENIIDV